MYMWMQGLIEDIRSPFCTTDRYCELPDMCADNQTRVLFKSSTLLTILTLSLNHLFSTSGIFFNPLKCVVKYKPKTW